MARKVLTEKRHGGCSYEVIREWTENSLPTEASMKKLINEEMSKGSNTRRNAPSIVARLMGMNVLPVDAKSVAHLAGKKSENPGTNLPNKEHNKKGSRGQAQYISNSSRKGEFDSFQYKDRDPNHLQVRMNLKKPRPREHPQEEELQKFKKEFEAWQAARFRECSKFIELGRIPSQVLAQETLDQERVALYANSSKISSSQNPVELKGHVVKAGSFEGGGLTLHGYKKDLFPSEQKESYSLRSRSLSRESGEFEWSPLMKSVQHHGYRKEAFPSEQKEPSYLRSRTLSRDFEWSPLMNPGQELDIYSSPTRTVILRPGPEQIIENDESWASSSGTSEQRGSIEDFLEEVKERLKCELQGKIKRGTMVRGHGTETPYSEKRTDTKKIAQRIAKQVRESVTRDLGMNLLRSESTRSYRSEIQYNEPGSPEFINKDTRRLLAERLRNVLKGGTNPHIPMAACGSSNSYMLDNGRGSLEQSVGNLDCWGIAEDEPEMQTRSFRGGRDDDVIHYKDLSPKNLIRSLSAPVSGTSFGKLLLEDRHIITGAHIRRKHESIESMTAGLKKQKESFNIKEKISSFKYSLTLRGRLFGRKVQPTEQPCKCECNSIKDITSGPTVMDFEERHENSTEVPPSPASVCSSVHEDLWRTADRLSTTSTSDLSLLEDTTVPHVFREISSNLDELRRQLNELDADVPQETITQEEHPLEAEKELEDKAEAYLRDLLVASGMYDGPPGKVLSRWDPLAKLVIRQIFEQVEESYDKMAKDDEGSKSDQGENEVDHKLLLDLLNEALSVVHRPPVNMSRFRKAIGPTPQPPYGRNLLNCVWEIVGAYLYPPTDNAYYSLDSMMARDLGSTTWSMLMSDDIDTFGKEMESQITGDLIVEIVKDMKPQRVDRIG